MPGRQLGLSHQNLESAFQSWRRSGVSLGSVSTGNCRMDNKRFGRDRQGRGKSRLHAATEAASPVEWAPLQRGSEMGTSGGGGGRRSRFKSSPRKRVTPALPQFLPRERPLQVILGITRLKGFLSNHGNRGHTNAHRHVLSVDFSLKTLRGSQIKPTYKTET